MRISLLRRLLELFTASLIGYIWGWIIGWSAFDPNLDVWALLAAIGAIGGLVAGLAGAFRRFGDVLTGATAGLFAGFWLRALVFGDRPGLPSVFLALVMAGMAGWWVASQPAKDRTDWMPVLLAALYAGFFGGLVIDVLILDALLHIVSQHSIALQGVWVLLSGLAGGLIARKTMIYG